MGHCLRSFSIKRLYVDAAIFSFALLSVLPPLNAQVQIGI